MPNQTLDDIMKLEAELNSGRGVSCVRSFVAYFAAGDIRSARACYNTEHDKICSYPELDAKIQKLLDQEE